MAEKRDYYEVLGVDKNADAAAPATEHTAPTARNFRYQTSLPKREARTGDRPTSFCRAIVSPAGKFVKRFFC